ncbi:hypothetical protein GOP47_0016620 [Adiantum capillus-veneris]|uniref:NADP-dependent oxidoreductase domain-containing protein n=1 Tax=Adiantum capillus-veneris TaxID=13818 RepID=A0A9D4ZC92_ADICA|nr:hypothetical protein GOP47_0016620 [Adiantum capillus-veneris]
MSMARALLLRAHRSFCSSAAFQSSQDNGYPLFLRGLCSAATPAAESDAAQPVPDIAANLIAGHADSSGTAQYAQRIGSAAGPGHFRQLRAGGQLGDLVVSSLGIGTFGGSETEEVDIDYIKTITRGFNLGINFIDTASNYRSMHSERAVGRSIAKAIDQGIIKRNEIVVCTKGGFLSFDYRESVDPRTYIEDKYVKAGLFQWEEFVGGVHCLSTPFVMNQLETSRRNLGLQTIDIYLIHNPEIELGIVARQTVLSRLRNLFAALEQAAKDGKISMYGVSTWNAFRVTSGSKNFISCEEMVNFAKEAAGSDNHHFKAIMVPFNLALQDVANNPVQNIKGRRLPLLHAAAHLNLNVLISSPLFQGGLVKGIAPEAREKFPELGDSRTPAQCALQFTRTTPGKRNAAIIKCPANVRG